MGIDISDEVEKSLKTAAKVPYDASTSMHLDFQNKKRSELQTLTYYVVKKAQELKVALPYISKMYKELELIEEKNKK